MEHKILTDTSTVTRETIGLAGIRDYMARHYHEPLSIEQLAGMAGLKPKYFADVFKKNYGQTAMDYLTELRIGRAKQYLMESDYVLREIALRVGYSDEFYFSRKFKKETGVPPSRFVTRRKSRIAVCSGAMMGQLLALNIMPVAAPLDSKWTHFYYNKYYDSIETHLRFDRLDQEPETSKLIRSRPDAVIGHEQMCDTWQEQLLLNAQPLFIPQAQDWDSQLRELAAFLGREGLGEEWIQRFECKAARAKELVLSAVGEDTCMVLRLCGNELHAYCNRGIAEYGELGLSPAYPYVERLYNEPIALEEVQRLSPQRLLLIICPDAATRMYWLSLQHCDGWRSLQAVHSGQVYQLPSDPWFEYSAVALDRMLDEAVLMFTGICPSPEQDKVHGCHRTYPI